MYIYERLKESKNQLILSLVKSRDMYIHIHVDIYIHIYERLIASQNQLILSCRKIEISRCVHTYTYRDIRIHMPKIEKIKESTNSFISKDGVELFREDAIVSLRSSS